MTAIETTTTTKEVAARFSDLAKEEKWFEIQDELFAENVKSIAAVRSKAEAWVSRIEAAHHRSTTEPVVAGNHFVVGREVDITVKELGRIQINQLMLYQVKDGRIVSEQFFY
jgi:hypothetical protein